MKKRREKMLEGDGREKKIMQQEKYWIRDLNHGSRKENYETSIFLSFSLNIYFPSLPLSLFISVDTFLHVVINLNFIFCFLTFPRLFIIFFVSFFGNFSAPVIYYSHLHFLSCPLPWYSLLLTINQSFSITPHPLSKQHHHYHHHHLYLIIITIVYIIIIIIINLSFNIY